MAVPTAAVPMTSRQGGSDGQPWEGEKVLPLCYQRCCLPAAQRHSACSVEIVLADVGNCPGQAWTLQGSGPGVVVAVGSPFCSPVRHL